MIPQNMCGMSVVGEDYNDLKRYNLAEIYESTPARSSEGEAEPSIPL